MKIKIGEWAAASFEFARRAKNKVKELSRDAYEGFRRDKYLAFLTSAWTVCDLVCVGTDILALTLHPSNKAQATIKYGTLAIMSLYAAGTSNVIYLNTREAIQSGRHARFLTSDN